MVRKIIQWVPIDGIDGETSLSMVTKIMEWVSIAASLLAVSCRPFASYQLAVNFVVCGGALVGVLALFFIKHGIVDYYDINNRSQYHDESSHCKTARVAVLSAPANAVETLMANTINAETRLIEEGALLPESVRSESDPWTSFLHGW